MKSFCRIVLILPSLCLAPFIHAEPVLILDGARDVQLELSPEKRQYLADQGFPNEIEFLNQLFELVLEVNWSAAQVQKIHEESAPRLEALSQGFNDLEATLKDMKMSQKEAVDKDMAVDPNFFKRFRSQARSVNDKVGLLQNQFDDWQKLKIGFKPSDNMVSYKRILLPPGKDAFFYPVFVSNRGEIDLLKIEVGVQRVWLQELPHWNDGEPMDIGERVKFIYRRLEKSRAFIEKFQRMDSSRIGGDWGKLGDLDATLTSLRQTLPKLDDAIEKMIPVEASAAETETLKERRSADIDFFNADKIKSVRANLTKLSQGAAQVDAEISKTALATLGKPFPKVDSELNFLNTELVKLPQPFVRLSRSGSAESLAELSKALAPYRSADIRDLLSPKDKVIFETAVDQRVAVTEKLSHEFIAIYLDPASAWRKDFTSRLEDAANNRLASAKDELLKTHFLVTYYDWAEKLREELEAGRLQRAQALIREMEFSIRQLSSLRVDESDGALKQVLEKVAQLIQASERVIAADAKTGAAAQKIEMQVDDMLKQTIVFKACPGSIPLLKWIKPQDPKQLEDLDYRLLQAQKKRQEDAIYKKAGEHP